MKFQWNKKYNTIALYTLIVICLGILFFQLVTQITAFKDKLDSIFKILEPFIIGFIMAYLFNFILKLYENKVFKIGKLENFFIKRKPISRNLGIVLTYITVIVVLYVFSNFIFPQLITSMTGIINNIPRYVDKTSRFFLDISEKLGINDEINEMVIEKGDELVNYSINFIGNLLPRFANIIREFLSSIWNLVIGTIVSIYLLSDKERFIALFKKMTYGIFPEKVSKWILEIGHRTNVIFSKFIGGKILDSTIVGILTFLILTLFKIPYPILISFIIGITNIIPFFGPFIGAIPSTLIILFESPIKAFWFIIIILIIQQIDGNIIGPKILGDSLGISSFWILFSLMVSGKLMGFAGMVIGVPLFTLIYSIIKDIIEMRLEKKSLPIDTEKYL